MAYEYRVGGRTVALTVDPTLVAIKFLESEPNSARATAAESAGVGPFATRYEIPGEKLTIVPTNSVPSPLAEQTSATAIRSLNAQSAVANAMPVFQVAGNRVVASDRLIVGLETAAAASEVAERYGLTLIRVDDRRMLASVPEGADVFGVLRTIESDPGVRYAEPDFITIGRHIPQRTDGTLHPLLRDPRVDGQYAMVITKAVDAWERVAGSPSVTIALLDDGVDVNHEDLKPAIAATYDAIDDDSYQNPNPWDGHGTACAGLAAALAADGTGIRGAGAGCSLMGVRIAYAPHKGADWITTNSVIARAIGWSWANGADVLSNSWGGGPPSNAIAEEFENARTKGRDGKGCVIVIAAGNDDGPVSFPGNLPSVLTVAASNEYDEAKTKTSRDNETWWGSNHGPEVGVAAPGVHNLTTDVTGAGGYDATDYVRTFNGTSSATPIVAGACGLVLSINPDLTEAQVRSLIMETAQKVGADPYVGGRNDRFGSGRLNVLRAVEAAFDLLPIMTVGASEPVG